jgi:hypothetical protein
LGSLQLVREGRMSDNAVAHINAFIDAFVAPGHRGGWHNALLDKPQKARKKLGRAERQLDKRFCSLVDDPEATLAALTKPGALVAFFDGSAPPGFLRLPEVISEWRSSVSDAIVSIHPGKVAVFLFHEGWGWRCERAA